MIVEFSADMVETFYNGNHLSNICESILVPVLALGAGKLSKEYGAFRFAADSVDAGAGGMFGRNNFQSKESQQLLDSLKEVVYEFEAPDTAGKSFNIE